MHDAKMTVLTDRMEVHIAKMTVLTDRMAVHIAKMTALNDWTGIKNDGGMTQWKLLEVSIVLDVLTTREF